MKIASPMLLSLVVAVGLAAGRPERLRPPAPSKAGAAVMGATATGGTFAVGPDVAGPTFRSPFNLGPCIGRAGDFSTGAGPCFEVSQERDDGGTIRGVRSFGDDSPLPYTTAFVVDAAGNTHGRGWFVGQKRDDDEPTMLALAADPPVDAAALVVESLEGKCPVCAKDGLRSTVTGGWGTVTQMGFPRWYDEDGKYHHHDGNVGTFPFSCSNGHTWTGRTVVGSCPCGWPKSGPYVPVERGPVKVEGSGLQGIAPGPSMLAAANDPPPDLPPADRPKRADPPKRAPAPSAVLDVRDLGAVGDNLADDTAPLQEALDRMARGEVACVRLPSGTYRTTAPLVFKGTVGRPAAIRGEVASPGGGGSTVVFAGAAGASCVLEVAGGFGIVVERLTLSAAGKARFGLYLHDRMPEAGMSDVILRDVAVGSPLAGDSPLLKGGARSAAISIGLRPDGAQDVAQCDSIKLVGVTITSTGDAHAAHYGIATGTANVKNFFIEHPWVYGFQVGLNIPNGTGTCTVTGGAGLSNTVADFLVGSGLLAVTGWESEGSARLLTTPGWHSGYASVSFDRCAWYGGPADDLAVVFAGNLAVRGCDLRNNRTPTSLARVGMGAPQNGSASSLLLEQNFFPGASADWSGAGGVAVLTNGSGSAPLVPRGGRAPAWVKCWGNVGGKDGKLTMMKPIN